MIYLGTSSTSCCLPTQTNACCGHSGGDMSFDPHLVVCWIIMQWRLQKILPHLKTCAERVLDVRSRRQACCFSQKIFCYGLSRWCEIKTFLTAWNILKHDWKCPWNTTLRYQAVEENSIFWYYIWRTFDIQRWQEWHFSLIARKAHLCQYIWDLGEWHILRSQVSGL